MNSAPQIRRLTAVGPRELDQLCDVLVDCVAGGASISFMSPFTHADAMAFWADIAAAVAARKRLLLVAEDAAGICGTVQLILDLPPNQPHRADVAKMMVHRRARRQGVGEALIKAAEAAALEHRRTLLVLDTVTGDAGSRLYERSGWIKAGDIPNYALYPAGGFCSTTYYYRDLGTR